MGTVVDAEQLPTPEELPPEEPLVESEVSVRQPKLDQPLANVLLTGRFVDYLCLTGSRLYGLSRIDSDYDYLAFGVPIPGSLFSMNPFSHYTTHQKEPDKRVLLLYHSGYSPRKFDVDLTVFSLRKFMATVLDKDIHWLEALFVPDQSLLYSTGIGTSIRANRHLFLSKSLYSRYRRYAEGEWGRTLGKNTRKLGADRKQDIEDYGYSRKNARNCLRLLQEGALLLRTGEMIFPLPDCEHDLLLDVANGRLSIEELETHYNRCLRELEEAHTLCEFPEVADPLPVEHMLIEACKIVALKEYGVKNG